MQASRACNTDNLDYYFVQSSPNYL